MTDLATLPAVIPQQVKLPAGGRRHTESQKRAKRNNKLKRYANDPAYRRKVCEKRRALRMGVSPEQFTEMLIAQVGLCALCEAQMVGYRDPALDHDHETGKIRGLLCWNCNLGLGHFKDDGQKLAAAIRYLQEHKL